jgi:L-ascorbate metabolism protein UlaG (beta-lactamase superfamily)
MHKAGSRISCLGLIAKGFRPAALRVTRAVLLPLALVAGAPQARAEAPTLLRWLGHGFFVVASRNAIKIAIDPFEPAQLAYQLPEKITANILLVTHESDLANATSKIGGSPAVFRSTTAVGVNRGAGITFNGVRTFRDPTRSPLAGRNVIFVFEVDGLRFAFLGGLGHRLDSDERRAVGRADVVVGAFGPPL